MDSGHRELEQLRQEWLDIHCDARHETRHPLFQPLAAWLQAPALGPAPIRVDVIDRSDQGLCLAVPGPCALAPGDELHLSIGEGVAAVPIRARVCWRKQTDLIVALGVAYDES